jgi:hypothetical protein
MKETKLSVWTRPVPGADMACVAEVETRAEADEVAARYENRRDLRHQDVEIRLGRHGKRVAFAGPLR